MPPTSAVWSSIFIWHSVVVRYAVKCHNQSASRSESFGNNILQNAKPKSRHLQNVTNGHYFKAWPAMRQTYTNIYIHIQTKLHLLLSFSRETLIQHEKVLLENMLPPDSKCRRRKPTFSQDLEVNAARGSSQAKLSS